MHLERQFALIRKSVPDTPYAERVSANGVLAQVAQKQTSAGGLQPTTFRRQDAIGLGVPILSNVSPGESRPNRARGHLTFMHKRVHLEKQAAASRNEKLTAAQLNAIKRRAVQDFRDLTIDEQREYAQEALQRAREGCGLPDEPSHARYDSSVLWHAGCRESPLSEDVFNALAKGKLGCDKVAHGRQNMRYSEIQACAIPLGLPQSLLSLGALRPVFDDGGSSGDEGLDEITLQLASSHSLVCASMSQIPVRTP